MPRRFVRTEGIATVTNLDDFVKGKITSCAFVAFFKNIYFFITELLKQIFLYNSL